MLKFLEEIRQKIDAEIAEHVRPEIRAMADQGSLVTKAQLAAWFENNGMNSWERDLLLPRLDNEALVAEAELLIKNLTTLSPRNKGYRPCSTYEEAVCMVIAPLLAERLRATIEGAKA